MNVWRFVTMPQGLCPIFPFFFYAPPTTEIYTLSLHDALPISFLPSRLVRTFQPSQSPSAMPSSMLTMRSEEHTSELQSPDQLVCRLLLVKKNSGGMLAATPDGNYMAPKSALRSVAFGLGDRAL